jgi:hypothetical protein
MYDIKNQLIEQQSHNESSNTDAKSKHHELVLH